MNTKRIVCALMCALLLVTAVVPAYADSSDFNSHIEYGLGVRTTSTAYLCSSYAKSTLKLAFVSGVNHMPQSDYVARAEAYAIYYHGLVFAYDVGNMSASATATPEDGITVTSSAHICTVNDNQVYYKTLP